jgi:hypothetical protein
LQEFGIDIAKLINEGGKELVFNEFGVGGGISPSGDQPARTSEQVRQSYRVSGFGKCASRGC